MQRPAAAQLKELEDYYNRLQSSYAKLTVTHFTLQGADADADTAHDPLIETENDSRLEEKEVDELHTGEMAGLGAKWEADAEAEEERLASARAAVERLSRDRHALLGQGPRLARLRDEFDRVSSRAQRFHDAEARREHLQRRKQHIAERRTRLEEQKQRNAALTQSQHKLRQDVLAAKEHQANSVAAEERVTAKRHALLQLFA